MKNDFETLISSFIENNVGVADHFLSDQLAGDLKINLLELYKQKLLFSASIGNADKLVQNTSVRNDSIYWLDRKHNNLHETDFLNLIEGFIKYLNISCYAGITDCEFHYSLYETGGFYKKHLDQFQNNSNRKYSMISYLNEDWKENDGGHLLIHQSENLHGGTQTKPHDQKIAPTNGKTVFFKSDELEHEVMLTTQRRMSVTGWLKSS